MGLLYNIDQTMLPFFYGGKNLFLDSWSLLLTNPFTWIPLYILLFYVIVKNNEKIFQLILILLFLIVCLALSDGLPDGIIKPYFCRLRPIYDPSLSQWVKPVRNYMPQGFSFFSAHAANTMAVAVFLSLLVRKRTLSLMLLSWSFLNGWSRLYLGVHFFCDVIIGFLWGVFAGAFSYLIYIWIYSKVSQPNRYISSQYTKTGFNHSDIQIVMNVYLYIILTTIIVACYNVFNY